jgi:two-component system response regulator YesN
MYKVLLVDDERIIREGIAHMINWESLGLSLIGTASNGQEASEMIENHMPDIVITDVKMPLIDGLALIAMENELHPDILFMVLSGYGEFELASGAMRYGVKHYLLKPCNENHIIAALKDAVDSLLHRDRREALVLESQNYLHKMKPMMREQFLRDYMVNGSYTVEETDYYCNLYNVSLTNYRVVIFQINRTKVFEDMYALRNITIESFAPETICMTATITNQLLVIVQHVNEDMLQDLMAYIKVKFSDTVGKAFTASYSDEVVFSLLPQAYRQAERCLNFSFYLGEGIVITKKDIEHENGENLTSSLIYDYDKIAIAIKSGNLEEVKSQCDTFFEKLKELAYETNVAKTYCMELFLTVVRQCSADNIESNLEKLAAIQQMDCIDQIRDIIRDFSLKLTSSNYDSIRNKQSKLVGAMIRSIKENIEDENLSLKWLANNVIFMNVGYLGRLFCKETGEKFSHYVLNVRMEKAKELIESFDDEKIYEVAKKIGFGDNPQYFSQLFKKCTGCTPSEYKALKTASIKL